MNFNIAFQGKIGSGEKIPFFTKLNECLPYEPVIQVLNEVNQSPILTCELLCKELKSGIIMPGVFSLHKNLLNYHGKDFSLNPVTVLNLSYSKLSRVPTSELTIQISKEQSVFELAFFEKETIEAWVAELQRLCILTDFHDKYEVVEIQEKPKSSNMCLLESKMGGKHFTAKIFKKDQWNSSRNFFEKTSLINEIETMRTLNYHRIPKLIEVQETESAIYLITEFLHNNTLDKLLKKPQWQTSILKLKTKNLIFSLLKTLSFMASQGIIHRNIKPANILIEGSTDVKIINFSLATFLDSPNVNFRTCGTPGYIAPEIFVHDEQEDGGKIYNTKCDIFSAGCIFFQMLFGFPLFSGSDSAEKFNSNKKGVSKDNRKRIFEETRSLKSCHEKQMALDLLLKMLEKDPTKRFTAAQALSHPYFEASNPKDQNFQDKFSMIESSHREKLLSLSPRSVRNSRKSSDASSNHSNYGTDNFQLETDSGFSAFSKPRTSLLIYNQCLNGGASPHSNSPRNDSSTLRITKIVKTPSSRFLRKNETSETIFIRKNCGADGDDEGWDEIFEENPNININFTNQDLFNYKSIKPILQDISS